MILPNNIMIRKFLLCILSIGLLVSCIINSEEPSRSQEELLHDLGIDRPSDYIVLPVCEKIEIYSLVGSEFLDIDHSAALVPSWMDDELSNQSQEKMAYCIATQGELLLKQWEDVYTSENENRAFRIHALIYKAAELDIIDDPQVENFVLRAICDKQVYYSGRLATLYHATTQSDLQIFPDSNEIIATICD